MESLALKRPRENWSFAPSGLIGFALSPTAYAVGFILEALRGNESLLPFRCVLEIFEILVLTHS